jgi:hypothetical protein
MSSIYFSWFVFSWKRLNSLYDFILILRFVYVVFSLYILLHIFMLGTEAGFKVT